MTPRRYIVAVRALCDFTAKRGDLDLRFTPAPSAQQGIEGHQTVASRRGATYRKELAVSGDYRGLVVRGRADGFDPERVCLEEVKTYKGDLERLPDNHRALHWAQVKIYGWLLCQQLGLADVTLSVVYFEIGSQRETAVTQHFGATELQDFFEAACERFLAWADGEVEHRQQRDASLTTLPFPHSEFRAGQRVLAEAVFRAARKGCCLMAQAPTGIGKTIGTVFPLLKACPEQQIDKVFFLSAKTPGRALALDALDRLGAAGPASSLRVLELVSRDLSCEHPDRACHGDSCPLARGFYDRLPAARAAATALKTMRRQALRDVALAHQVCPYYLSQEMARWSDVVVGDYNHYFDGAALLHGLAQANGWRVAVLVDEAHNLIDRARGMYSAELDQSVLRVVCRQAPAELKKPLGRLHRAWTAVNKAQSEVYQVHAACPPKLASALQSATAAVEAHLAEQPTGIDSALLQFYFDALQLRKLLETFGDHSMIDLTLRPVAGGTRSSVLNLRNVTPAPFLAPRMTAARSVVLFSATLTPRQFYDDSLGLPGDTAWLDVEAPFRSEQLVVNVVRNVSTRYRDRARSLAPIARRMAIQFAAEPGNYLAFFSSFEYLQQAAQAFESLHTGTPIWCQHPRMGEAQREAFLERFTETSQGIGFAVLGGAFAEGIDLPGQRLIGAFIATLGLPQINPVNEALRRRIDALYGTGYDYVYLFPGIRKVVQAAGRVIRSASDRGCLHLIDDRFARAEVRRLLPMWWNLQSTRNHGTEIAS